MNVSLGHFYYKHLGLTYVKSFNQKKIISHFVLVARQTGAV